MCTNTARMGEKQHEKRVISRVGHLAIPPAITNAKHVTNNHDNHYIKYNGSQPLLKFEQNHSNSTSK